MSFWVALQRCKWKATLYTLHVALIIYYICTYRYSITCRNNWWTSKPYSNNTDMYSLLYFVLFVDWHLLSFWFWWAVCYIWGSRENKSLVSFSLLRNLTCCCQLQKLWYSQNNTLNKRWKWSSATHTLHMTMHRRSWWLKEHKPSRYRQKHV